MKKINYYFIMAMIIVLSSCGNKPDTSIKENEKIISKYILGREDIEKIVIYQYNDIQKSDEYGGTIVVNGKDDIIDILSKLTKDTEVITIDDIEKHSLKGGVTFQIKYEDKSVVGVYWNFPTNQVEIFGETYYIDEKELKELSELLYDYWEG